MQALVPEAAKLLDAMHAPEWIAESPEVHLPPHLRRACSAQGSSFILEDAATDEAGVFVVSLRWIGNGISRSVTEAVWALLGAVIESSAFVHGPGDDAWRPESVWEIVTGMLRPDTTFEPPGHSVRLVVHGA